MSVSPILEQTLNNEHIPFAHHGHPATYTARQTAEAGQVPVAEMAKTVVIMADGRLLLAILPADRRVDLHHLQFITRAQNIRLATEQEFMNAFPSCETGAMPPIGRLFGLATYCDTLLAENDDIEFNAGSHSDTVRMAFDDFKRVASPTMIDLVLHPRA